MGRSDLKHRVHNHIAKDIAFCYAFCMVQLVTRVGDDLAEALDELIEEGVAESRSDAVRQALSALVEQHRRERIGRQILDGYLRIPQTEEEIAWSDDATLRMITEEPW